MATLIKIASVQIGSGGAASATFSSIPASFTDLKIIGSARTSNGESGGVVYFNSDTTNTNYTSRRLIGEGSGSASSATANYPYFLYMCCTGDSANAFSYHEIYIPNYTSSLAKPISSMGVRENNGVYVVTAGVAGLWNPGTQAPITSIVVKPYNEGGASFVEGTNFSLYGISKI